jgi:phosphoglycerol transferase MdoB-like AlkP superfamily enzyme
MNRNRLLQRLRGTGAPLLDLRARVYLLALLGPLFTYSLSLKLVRIGARPEETSPLMVLQLLRSDILFDLGYALLWAGLFIVAKSGVPRRSVTVAFHVVTILVAVVSTATHFYYVETGSALNVHFISYYLSSFGEIQSVLTSKVSAGAASLAILPLAYAVFGPWLLARALDRRGGSRSSGGGGYPTYRARESWLGFTGALLAASGLFLFALPANPEATGASESFIRAPLVGLVSAEIEESAYEDQVEVDEAKVRENLPRDTTLSATPRTGKRNVVLIQLESTRARSVTPYNEELRTTPFLDSLAEKSLVAENAYTTVPHTSNSITAINCGTAPPTTPRGTDSLAEDVPSRCLPKLLSEQGYNTAFFQSATQNFESRRKVVENFGYEDFFPLESMDKEGFERTNYFGYEDNIMLEPSRKWLSRNGDQPFMATYLTITAHDDYGVPSRYGEKQFSEDPLLNRYQNTVRYQDFFVRNLIQQYKDMGLYEDTVFVITGDHGEAFGEHGRFQHDKVPYEEGVKIPMMIHDPKRQGWTSGGASVDGLANQLDLLPSITGLLGYRVEGGEYPGEPLWNLPENGTLNFSCWGSRECLASLEGDMKYIYYYGDKPDELYDLSRDPLEKNNLLSDPSQAERSEAEDRRQRVLTWWAKVQAMYRD